MQQRSWCYIIIIVTWLLLLWKDNTALSFLASDRLIVHQRTSSLIVDIKSSSSSRYKNHQWRQQTFHDSSHTTTTTTTTTKSSHSSIVVNSKSNHPLISTYDTDTSPPEERPSTTSSSCKEHQNTDNQHLSIDSTTIQYITNNGCVVELIEPETNCTVRIIGVFHGSPSSSNDVIQCFANVSSSDMIVLELCSDRYRDLILKNSLSSSSFSSSKTATIRESSDTSWDEIASEKDEFGVSTTIAQSQRDAPTTSTNNPTLSTSWLEQYIRLVYETMQQQGWNTGIVVAVFGLVNGVQQQILQLQPGLEFTTAAEIATNGSIPILLADQDVAITLQRMSQIPHVAYEMWSTFIRERSWNKSFGPPSLALSMAIFGGWMPSLQRGERGTKLLTLPQFLIRNLASIQDLLRYLGLPLLVIQILYVLVAFQDTPSALNTVAGTTGSVQQDLDPMITTLLNILVTTLFYLSVALPATQVILMERDDVLTNGIRTACRLTKVRKTSMIINKPTTEKSTMLVINLSRNDTYHHDTVVVVVLGLLHVNGVAIRLSQRRDQKK